MAALPRLSPLYPSKRTSERASRMSALGQQATVAGALLWLIF